MTIVFFSNFINHHQVCLSDELFTLTCGNYFFVCTSSLPNSMKKSGYPDYFNRHYVINVSDSHENWNRALELAINADVAIFGGGAEINIFRDERLRLNKLSFEYSERWLKKGFLNLFSPNLIKFLARYHFKYPHDNYYALCASGYGASDWKYLHAFRQKCFKWGYFTRVDDLDLTRLPSRDNSEFSIMWCSRFIHWKHPEMPVKLADYLKRKGYSFRLDMFGNGPQKEHIERLVSKKHLDDCVFFLGNVENSEIIRQMQRHDLFLITSDRNEGWGAVVNEAMANGCVVVSNEMVGSVPFLIDNARNGRVYKDGNLFSMTRQVEYYINNPTVRFSNAALAYETMAKIWNPHNAADNFINLASALMQRKPVPFFIGPCSSIKE